MGQVYEVKHVALGRRFAMKVLRRELARDAELAARFTQEAKATACVRHPNVVAIADFGQTPDGAPYFVMELLEGETLGHVIKAGGADAPRGARVRSSRQAGCGRARRGARRGRRPPRPQAGQCLPGGRRLGRRCLSDDARVVDFGAAKIIGSSHVTRQGIVFGTPHYMSPEQASGAQVDQRADIYALGVIMYEMFTGRVPFEADTYMGVLTQHMYVKPVPPSDVSPAGRELGALEEITLTCLAKKPEDRYASMEALAEALEAVVKVGSDGHVRIAARAPSSKPPASVRFRMADELEPPTLAEMRGAIDSVLPIRRVVPWAWILGGAGVLAAAVGVGPGRLSAAVRPCSHAAPVRRARASARCPCCVGAPVRSCARALARSRPRARPCKARDARVRLRHAPRQAIARPRGSGRRRRSVRPVARRQLGVTPGSSERTLATAA